jgi:predicted transcriptional regulator
MALGMPTKIREIMSKHIVTIGKEKSAIDVARLMTEKGVGHLLVTKDGKTIGIITERDLVVKVLAKG